MDHVFYDQEPSHEREDCEVVINGNKITVSHKEGGEHVTYKGIEVGPGHYELIEEGCDTKATLHRSPKSHILEGFWIAEGYKGFWRIELLDDVFETQ
ncbi:MAG: hypothetical protein GY729_00050 [Desulfobacteraceae bacterium]|nr:hypothetical protein [Desulfobacteraceae bacterium]